MEYDTFMFLLNLVFIYLLVILLVTLDSLFLFPGVNNNNALTGKPLYYS